MSFLEAKMPPPYNSQRPRSQSTSTDSMSSSPSSSSDSEGWEVVTVSTGSSSEVDLGSSESEATGTSGVSESTSTEDSDVGQLTPESSDDGNAVDPFADWDGNAEGEGTWSCEDQRYGDGHGYGGSEGGVEGEDGEWDSDEDEESSEDEYDSDEYDSEEDSSDDEDDREEEYDSEEEDESDDEDVPGLIDCIRKQPRGTKIILVVGQEGSGKSTFLRDLTECNLNTGETTAYSSRPYPVDPNDPERPISDWHLEFQVCEDIIDDQPYLLIELPPFTCTKRDRALFYELMYFVLPSNIFAPTHCTLAGVMFVFDIAQHRLTSTDIHNIQLFKTLFGPALFHCLTVVSTKWDRLTKDEVRDTVARFEANILAHPAMDFVANNHVLATPAANNTRFETNMKTYAYTEARCYHHGVMLTHGVKVNDDFRGEFYLTYKLKSLGVKTHGAERTKIARKIIQQFYGDISTTTTNHKLQALRELGWEDYNGQEVEATRVMEKGIACDGEVKLGVDEDGFLRVESGYRRRRRSKLDGLRAYEVPSFSGW